MKDVIQKFRTLEKKDQLIFFLICSTISNFFIGIIKFIFSLTIPSLWFFVNAGFSFVLAICRFLTIKRYKIIRTLEYKELQKIEEYKTYIQNGIMLIILGIMYFFVSSYMYYKGTNTNMHEYITYLVALIAFTSVGTAIYGMIKYKRNQEPIIKGIKITNFANALTSIVLTQVVLLDTYANEYDSTLNGYTGMGVSLIIIGLGLYMIISMKKENCYKFLYAISIFLVIGFGIRLGVDYFKYNTINNSAPFYTYIIVRGLEFIVPSIVVFIVGIFCKKKYKKEYKL